MIEPSKLSEDIESQTKFAKDLASEGKCLEAAEEFKCIGHRCIGLNKPVFDSNSYPRGFANFSRAIICFRLAGKDARARLTARIGKPLAEEILSVTSDTEANFTDIRCSSYHEFVGDFYLLAGMDGWKDHYNTSKETLDDRGDVHIGMAEIEHRTNIGFWLEIIGCIDEIDIDEWHQKVYDQSFPEWVDWKQEEFQEYVSAILDSGEWNPPY